MGLGVKQLGLEAEHSPVADVKNDRTCISYPPRIASGLHGATLLPAVSHDICSMMYLGHIGYLSSAYKHSPSQTENFALCGYYLGKYWQGW
jgi:hypothetical protein